MSGSEQKSYRVGVIGFAHMHVNELVDRFAATGRSPVVACADTAPSTPSRTTSWTTVHNGGAPTLALYGTGGNHRVSGVQTARGKGRPAGQPCNDGDPRCRNPLRPIRKQRTGREDLNGQGGRLDGADRNWDCWLRRHRAGAIFSVVARATGFALRGLTSRTLAACEPLAGQYGGTIYPTSTAS